MAITRLVKSLPIKMLLSGHLRQVMPSISIHPANEKDREEKSVVNSAMLHNCQDYMAPLNASLFFLLRKIAAQSSFSELNLTS